MIVPPMEDTNRLRLVTLHPNEDPQQCDEVVRMTEEYRRRPLTAELFSPQPFNPDKHIQCALNALRQLVGDLCIRAAIWQADETLSAAATDWFERNAAVFLTKADSGEEVCPGWIQSSTMTATVYCHVLNELVADIRWFRNEGNRVFFSSLMNLGRRHAFKSHMALHASAVFVSSVPRSDLDLVYYC